MFGFLKHNNKPDYIVGEIKKDGMIEQIWDGRGLNKPRPFVVPEWWNEEIHAMLEVNTIGGKGYHKFCQVCKKKLPESGCLHNLNHD